MNLPRSKLHIEILNGAGESSQFTVESSVLIGRDESCQIRIDHPNISRRHAEVFVEDDVWRFRDLNSSNGSFVDGKPIKTVEMSEGISISLGRNGPVLRATIEKQPPRERNVAVLDANYYFGESSVEEGAGERTMFIRQAFKQVQRKHRRRNGLLIAISAAMLLTVGSYALYQRSLASRQRQLAEALFYSVKSVELDVAKSEETLVALKGPEGLEAIRRNREKHAALEAEYERFLKEMGLYANQLSEQDRLILRVTRIFGECELGMPRNYVDEVKRYIGYWKATDRLKSAITSAENHNYTNRISSALLAQDLPPQFFYLALQESSFEPYAVGPRTKKGIAKGMWQFIPETAVQYGLTLGPLQDLPRPDPGDERDNFEKSTDAAARYLKFIYTTDAQASGLLVMASYNWGEGKVIPLIRQLPASPRDRNFWRLLSVDRDKLPKETYDYVFYIVAAAVIGEDPRAFGFDFENPLRHLEKKPNY